MTTEAPIKKIIILSLLILLLSFGIYYVQLIIQHSLHNHSQLSVEIHTYDPGLQASSIDDIYALPDRKWLEKNSKTYNNLYIEQTLWERIKLINNAESEKIIVISERGNYVTQQIIYSDLKTTEVTTSFSDENFKQKLILPAKANKIIYIKKTGYQLNNNSTQILEYHTYRLQQLLGLISSTWAYGTILGIGTFYLISIQSRQTQLSERLAILGLIATAILITATEKNFHSLIELAPPSIENIGKKIALPLILAPLSSYLLLRTFNIASNRHPMQQLSIAFFISTLLLAYCLINNYIVPIIYLSFTTLSFVHQICWLHHACKSQQLNSIGQTASISFVLAGTANHILVILLIAFPELTIARLNIINAYYLIGISSAVAMLNDKNITQFIKRQIDQQTQQRISLSNAKHKEAQRMARKIDILLSDIQKTLLSDLSSAALTVKNLRLLNMEATWRRQLINTQALSSLLYEKHAQRLIQKKTSLQPDRQHFCNFNNAIDLITGKNAACSIDVSNSDKNTLDLYPNTKTGTIIIIDDNSSAAITTAKAIQKQGYLIEIFTNPLQAMHYIAIKTSSHDSSDKIIAVITDYDMPELNGTELLSEVDKLYTTIDTPKLIIFSSMSRHIKTSHGIQIIDKTKPNNLIAALNYA